MSEAVALEKTYGVSLDAQERRLVREMGLNSRRPAHRSSPSRRKKRAV
jgi:hypothetical protein